MTSIADLLGVDWAGAGESYSLHPHAAKQIVAKGFDLSAVLSAANQPSHTYPNGRYAGQVRHVRAGIVAVVDPRRRIIITVYADQCETALRPDQRDRDALAYGRRIASHS